MKVKVVKPEDKISVDVNNSIDVAIKPTINVEIVNSNKKKIDFSLDMRKALNGDLMIFDSIQGGNVYGSLEGKIHESKERDSIKATIYQISEWISSEAPYIEATKGHDEQMEDELLKPDGEHSTELGEVPHEEEKGSIVQHSLFAPYLYGRYTY
jgi:hypothetical protein